MFRVYPIFNRYTTAEVAELVDALDSKSSVRKNVWVRVPPSVLADNQHISSSFQLGLFCFQEVR